MITEHSFVCLFTHADQHLCAAYHRMDEGTMFRGCGVWAEKVSQSRHIFHCAEDQFDVSCCVSGYVVRNSDSVKRKLDGRTEGPMNVLFSFFFFLFVCLYSN